jgi:hypothetical protein
MATIYLSLFNIMTRKKKTRSLKSIHSVKTGSISKLKRSSTTDRQSTNLNKGKAKPKSVYQKFLDENPDAIEKQQQPISAEQLAKKAAEKALAEKQIAEKATANKKKAPKPSKAKTQPEDEKKEHDKEREPDLLSQLDNKNFNDFY